jgi:hypothetical protein
MKTSFFAALLFAIASTASAVAETLPIPPEMQNLEPVKAPMTLVVPKNVEELIKAKSWAMADIKRTFLAGRYMATKENALGTLYQAENYAFADRIYWRPFALNRGGLWVPKSGDQKPRLYIMTNSRPMQVDSAEDLDPAKIAEKAHPPGPLVIGVAGAAGIAAVSIANGIVSAAVESGYAKGEQETFLDPVTNPDMIKALDEAVAQLKPAAAPVPALAPAQPE